jgi:16S rRNA (guanine(966)-N(2))-methyltransferase RsmD
MRIISGTLKGRRIEAPGNLPVRPTTDFAKEGLFNVLMNRIDFEEIKFLDLFSGTGNISFEMASRGCLQITCVDEDKNCFTFINKTAKQLKLDFMRVYRADVFRFCETISEKFDLIFADPPFDEPNIVQIPDLIFNQQLLNSNGLLIIEHPKQIDFSNYRYFTEVRKYGKIRFSFFKMNDE